MATAFAASRLVEIVTAEGAAARDRSVDAVCRRATVDELLAECAALEAFRHQSGNLYERVRACFFLYAIHRFHLPGKLAGGEAGGSGERIPVASAPGSHGKAVAGGVGEGRGVDGGGERIPVASAPGFHDSTGTTDGSPERERGE
jgi:hypothetical protein